MLWLIKWVLILLIVGGIWFSYSFISNLSTEERHGLKSELIETIDNKSTDKFQGPMMQKAKEDFFQNIKYSLKSLVSKILD